MNIATLRRSHKSNLMHQPLLTS